MRFLRIFFGILNKLKTLILTFLLLGSLAMNIVLFVGGSFFAALNSGFEALTGMQSIASRNKAEIANLSEEVIVERNAKREIKGQLTDTTADLADTKLAKQKLERETKQLTADLVAERKTKREIKAQLGEVTSELATSRLVRNKLQEEAQQAAADAAAERKVKRELRNTLAEQTAELATYRTTNRQLKSQIRDLGMGVVPFKGKKVALKAAVDETADTIGKRAVKTAKREVASMPGEAIPYLGTAIIVGVTALEISDLCATLKDMTALKKAFNPDFSQSDEELEVCSIEIPPKDEIIAAVKASPQNAWNAAKEASPTWEEIKDMEMPDVTWSELWEVTKDGSVNIWDSTSDGMSSFGGKVKKWWNNGSD